MNTTQKSPFATSSAAPADIKKAEASSAGIGKIGSCYKQD